LAVFISKEPYKIVSKEPYKHLHPKHLKPKPSAVHTTQNKNEKISTALLASFQKGVLALMTRTTAAFQKGV